MQDSSTVTEPAMICDTVQTFVVNRGVVDPGSLSVRKVLAVDHVVVIVQDLDAAARRYDEQYGLASIAGGRHSGHGTGNRIVPLGSSDIELMAVVDHDEAASSPMGSWLQRRLVEVGEGPEVLCLRTDDIEAAALRTGREPLEMSRSRPDGVELKWHLVALAPPSAKVFPFSSSGMSMSRVTRAAGS